MTTENAHSSLALYGRWQVLTEGDCEGRSPRQIIGVFDGFPDEIAERLLGHEMFSFTFRLKPGGETTLMPPMLRTMKEGEKITISCVSYFFNQFVLLDGMSIDLRALQRIWADRPFAIEESNFYCSFDIRKLDDNKGVKS